MARLVIEVSQGHKSHQDYQSFEKDEVYIGRGFDNDVIINDPYISAQHLVIFQQNGAIKIKNLSSKNGVYMPKIKQNVFELMICSGDELILGRTRIRVFLDSHKIPPTKALHQNLKHIKWLKNSAVACTLSLILILMTLLETFLATSTKESLIKLIPAPIFTCIVILFWAGFWTLIGRVVRHKIRFFIHISVFCLWGFIHAIFKNCTDYLSFYLNNPMFNSILNHLFSAGLFILVLYTSLSFSTHMSKKAKIIFIIFC